MALVPCLKFVHALYPIWPVLCAAQSAGEGACYALSDLVQPRTPLRALR
jgi:hypothetical protein